MSPGILEIAKAKDDDEDYLEIEIYEDLEFWKGVGTPAIIPIIIGIFFLLVDTMEGIAWCLFSITCLWPLIGIGLALYAQRNDKRNYSIGAYTSAILGIIIGIVLVVWIANAIGAAWVWGYG